jgi:hypothetical protein
MHASFSFHHPNLQLAYTTQEWNFNLKLVPCKQAYEMHIQMHHQVYELAPPTCVLKILIDPLTLSYFSLCQSSLPLSDYFSPLSLISLFLSPFVINDHEGSILDRLRLSMSINGVGILKFGSI